MVESIINCRDPEKADVVLLGAPYDGTSSYGKGADNGPQAIIDCLHTQIEFYERISGSCPVDRLKISYYPVEELRGLAPSGMVERLSQEYAKFPGKLRIILGGEHSVSNAAWRCLVREASQITIVQIDAHADFRQDDSDYRDQPSGEFAHCSVMRRAWESGFNLLQMGIRAYSQEEKELFTDARIKVFEWGRREPSIEEVLASIPTKKVYLTIDADGLDPAFMPATGTPVQAGLSWYYTLDLIKNLCSHKNLVGADIVEVAPRPGDRLTEFGAAQLCYTIIGCWVAGR